MKHFQWRISLALILVAPCQTTGCAGTSIKPTAEDSQSEKVAKLEKDLETQQKIIERLRASLDQKSNPRLAPHPLPKAPVSEPALPARKLLPDTDSDLLEKDDLNKILGADEQSIADSSHESMHYYYDGLKKIEEQKFDEAVKELKFFIDENPTHVYADRAQYLIVDAYFQAKEFGLCVVSANLLETRYPYSIRVASAKEKRALALAQMKQTASSPTQAPPLMDDVE